VPPPTEQTPLRDRALRIAARYGAPALLVVVALVHGHETRHLDLSPWKGAGFGMFSTVDSPSARFLRLVLETPGGDVPVPPPARLSRTIREAHTLPTRRRLDRLATRFAAATWAVPELPRISLAHVEETPESTQEEGPPLAAGLTTPMVAPVPIVLAGREVPAGLTPIEFSAVRVELWRYRFDPEHARLEMSRIRGVRKERIVRRGERNDG
jgi:hypothetical protein